MKLIVGLGNVGAKYENTRHNAGFKFVDEFDKFKPKGAALHKPDTMMNNSGAFVAKLINKNNLDISNLYIVHDDLDLPLGGFKIQFGKGPKVHNGINSIEEHLGSGDFWRVRIGVDNRDTDNRTPGDKYVLEEFTPEEREKLFQVMKNATTELVLHLQNVDR